MREVDLDLLVDHVMLPRRTGAILWPTGRPDIGAAARSVAAQLSPGSLATFVRMG